MGLLYMASWPYGANEDYIEVEVDHAVKGPDYVHGYNADGELIIAFDGVTDFECFDYTGEYMLPDECLEESCNDVKHVCGQLVRRDGTIIGSPGSPGGGGGGDASLINDTTTSSYSTWSSKKISQEINAKVGDIESVLDEILTMQRSYISAAKVYITFRLCGKEFTAYEHMTWLEWAESAYNTAGVYIHESIHAVVGPNGDCIFWDGDEVSPDDAIVADREYTY